eukprot:2114314-Amphidinium_carterae.1
MKDLAARLFDCKTAACHGDTEVNICDAFCALKACSVKEPSLHPHNENKGPWQSQQASWPLYEDSLRRQHFKVTSEETYQKPDQNTRFDI